MPIYRPAIFALAILLMASSNTLIQAQESDNAPIYLDEPEPEPPARVGKRQTIKDTYKDKSVRAERQVVRLSDDRVLNDGKYIEYYRDGQKYCEGTYKMGVFHGDWQYWFPNGQLCKKITYVDGKSDGQWEVFDKEGKRVAQQSYRNGKRHGKWVTYHEGGEQPYLELTYEDGLPAGERISYFANGQKQSSVPFKNGKFNGMLTEWNESGEKIAELEFKDGARQGKVVRFDK